MANTDEALKIWNALKPMIDRQIEAKTRSCVRAKKMTVSTPPDGSLIGVTAPYQDEIMVPYSSALSDAQAGDAVWVWWFFNNASTMIALTFGDGQPQTPGSDAVPMPVGSIYMSVSNQNPANYFDGTWVQINGHEVYAPEEESASLSRSAAPVMRTSSESQSAPSAARNRGMPVGTVYMSIYDTNPSSLFGGEWEQINGSPVYPPEEE